MRVKVIFDSRLRLGDYSKVVIPIPHNVEYVQDLVEHLRETFGLNETDTGRITVSIDDFVITNNQLVKDVLVNDDMVRIRCERTPDVRSPLGSVSMHRTEDEFVMIERPIKRFRESVKSESTSSPKYSMQLPDPIAASDSKVAESSSSLNEPVEPGASEEYPSEVTHPAPGQTQTCALHSDQEDEEKNVRHSPASPALSTASSPFVKIQSSGIVEPSDLKLDGPDHDHVKRADEWRERQRKKSFAALRRQLEWFVKLDGPLTLDALMCQPRVQDLAETTEDILDAVSRSDKLRFVSDTNTVELKLD